jgi:hypothetical protein
MDLFEALFAAPHPPELRLTALVRRSDLTSLAIPAVNIVSPRRNLHHRLFAKASRLAGTALRRIRPSQPPASWLDTVLDDHGIEFVVSLDPWNAATLQPFLTFVWDLNHR